MGVLRITKPTALMPPLSPQPSRTPLRALGLKPGRARRALTLLGPNDTRKNLDFIDSLLTISAEQFARKWNFDPIQGKPLPPGRYLWSPVRSATSSTNTSSVSNTAPSSNTKSGDVSKENEPSSLELCLKLPRADLHQVYPLRETSSPKTDSGAAGERSAKQEEEEEEGKKKKKDEEEVQEQCPCLARSQAPATTTTGSCRLHARAQDEEEEEEKQEEGVVGAATAETPTKSAADQPLRQTKITEFARSKKRFLPHRCDIVQDLEPPRKKLSVRE